MHHGPGDMDHMLLERIDGKSRIAKALCLKYEVEKFLQICLISIRSFGSEIYNLNGIFPT